MLVGSKTPSPPVGAQRDMPVRTLSLPVIKAARLEKNTLIDYLLIRRLHLPGTADGIR